MGAVYNRKSGNQLRGRPDRPTAAGRARGQPIRIAFGADLAAGCVLVHLGRGEIVFEVENRGSRPATVVDARLVSVRPGARQATRLDWDERQSYVPPYGRRLVRLKLEEQNIRGALIGWPEMESTQDCQIEAR